MHIVKYNKSMHTNNFSAHKFLVVLIRTKKGTCEGKKVLYYGSDNCFRLEVDNMLLLQKYA